MLLTSIPCVCADARADLLEFLLWGSHSSARADAWDRDRRRRLRVPMQLRRIAHGVWQRWAQAHLCGSVADAQRASAPISESEPRLRSSEPVHLHLPPTLQEIVSRPRRYLWGSRPVSAARSCSDSVAPPGARGRPGADRRRRPMGLRSIRASVPCTCNRRHCPRAADSNRSSLPTGVQSGEGRSSQDAGEEGSRGSGKALVNFYRRPNLLPMAQRQGPGGCIRARGNGRSAQQNILGPTQRGGVC
jgi:hypothetical protein